MATQQLDLPIPLEDLREILQRYGAVSAKLFGSYARGEATAESDLDLLVELAPGRSLFDDIDDYNGLSVQPPADRWGIPLGTDDGDGTIRQSTLQLASGYLAQYRVQVTVYYLQNTALTTPLPYGVTTNYRGAQVQVSYDDPQAGWQQLVTLTRVFSYVPSP